MRITTSRSRSSEFCQDTLSIDYMLVSYGLELLVDTKKVQQATELIFIIIEEVSPS